MFVIETTEKLLQAVSDKYEPNACTDDKSILIGYATGHAVVLHNKRLLYHTASYSYCSLKAHYFFHLTTHS